MPCFKKCQTVHILIRTEASLKPNKPKPKFASNPVSSIKQNPETNKPITITQLNTNEIETTENGYKKWRSKISYPQDSITSLDRVRFRWRRIGLHIINYTKTPKTRHPIGPTRPQTPPKSRAFTPQDYQTLIAHYRL